MSNRIATAIAAAALTATTLTLAAPSPAHAEDHRPCVSKVEIWTTQLTKGVTLGDLEVKWDVRGKAMDRGLAPSMFKFPVCGYSLDEEFYLVVIFDHNPKMSPRDVAALMVLLGKNSGATLHGRP